MYKKEPIFILNPRVRIEFAGFGPNLCGLPAITSFTQWEKSQHRAKARRYWTKLCFGLLIRRFGIHLYGSIYE